MKSNISIEDCKKIAASKNGECLSSEYKNNHEKLKWKCNVCFYEWLAPLITIKNNHWCPKCARNVRLSIDLCKDRALEMGGECLSLEYKNNHEKLKWKCKNGHVWESNYNNVVRSKFWCPICSGMAKRTIADCKKIAESLGGECLSLEYKNNHEKLKWKCNNGHIWLATFSSILTGHWCHFCANKYKSQNKLKSILEKILCKQAKQNQRCFDWLVNKKTGRKFEIDIYFEDLKLAVEYDGRHHFFPEAFNSMLGEKVMAEFAMVCWRDNEKNRLIEDHIRNNGNDIKYFVRFKYNDFLTDDFVFNKLKEVNLL